MEVIKTEIEDVVIIEPRLFKDERGYFFESFSQRGVRRKSLSRDFRAGQREHVIVRRMRACISNVRRSRRQS